MLSIGPWFETLGDPEPMAFRARIAGRVGPQYRASSFFATAYAAVALLVAGLEETGTDEPHAVFSSVAGRARDTVLGRIEINPITRHTSLIPRLAVADGGAFRILSNTGQVVSPAPYLTTLAVTPVDRKPNLRSVS